MKTVLDFPKVDLPGVDHDEVQAVRDLLDEAARQADHLSAQQADMVLSMIRLGKRPSARTRPDKQSRASRKARKAHR